MTDSAKNMAQKVRESAEGVASQLGDQVHRQAVGAFHQVGDTADTWISNAGKGLQDWGQQLQQAGRRQGGLAATAADAVGRRLQDGGSYLSEIQFGGLTEALTTTVKRNPLTAVLIAAGVGWMLARRFNHR